MRARLRFGTSSWSEKSWLGTFYPAGTPPGDWLTHYAAHFDTVEADVTYYRIPDERLVDGWNAKTPEGFTIAAKFPRSIVHAGDGPKPDGSRVCDFEQVGDDVLRFLAAMARLGPKCGPLLLQFPYFNRQAFASARPFLERLDRFLGELPAQFRYAVEIRNKTWIDEALLDVLRRHRAALVLVDIAYMPHPAVLAGELDVVTTDFVYGRLIGDRKAIDQITTRFDQIVVDQSARLERWAKLLATLRERTGEIVVYANNHYAGHAPDSIRDLIARVERT